MKIKRIIATLMCLLMMVLLFPVGAFADDTSGAGGYADTTAAGLDGTADSQIIEDQADIEGAGSQTDQDDAAGNADALDDLSDDAKDGLTDDVADDKSGNSEFDAEESDSAFYAADPDDAGEGDVNAEEIDAEDADPDETGEFEEEEESEALFIGGSGTESDPYQIGSVDDWNAFAQKVRDGEHTACAVMTDDVGPVTEQIGDYSWNWFSGTFDGAGHTITVNYEDDNPGNVRSLAPFCYISDATIKRLTVRGTIKGYLHTAGLVGTAMDTSTNHILSCAVYTDITIKDGKTHAGGILGHGKDSNTEIRNCLFAGSIDGANHVGGIFGWCDGGCTPTITNCLEDGSYTGSGVNPVGLITDDRGTVTNTYYKTQTIGFPDQNTTRGTYTEASGSELAAMLGNGWTADGDSVIPVTDDNNIAYAQISGIREHYTKTGSAIPITYAVSDLSGKALTEGVHYSVSLTLGGSAVSEVKAQGQYTLTFTGISPYHSSQSVTFTVDAGVRYLDENGKIKTCSTYSLVESTNNEWTTGWYVVDQDVTIAGTTNRLWVRGDVKLILSDCARLTIEGSLKVPSGSSLTIYAQSEGEDKGELYAGPAQYCLAGISVQAGETRLNSETPNTNGDEDANPGKLVICGGKIVARGGNFSDRSQGGGAGIGSDKADYAGIVIIRGGDVTATGGARSAGIGGGAWGIAGTVEISGGSVTAQGSEEGAGIGGGAGETNGMYGFNPDASDKWGRAGNITISGGYVRAKTGGRDGANGIGTGGGREAAASGNVVITGGQVVTDSFGSGINFRFGWTDQDHDYIRYDGKDGTFTLDKEFAVDSQDSYVVTSETLPSSGKLVPLTGMVTVTLKDRDTILAQYNFPKDLVCVVNEPVVPRESGSVFRGWYSPAEKKEATLRRAFHEDETIYAWRNPTYNDFTVQNTVIEEGTISKGEPADLFDKNKATEVEATLVDATVEFTTAEPVYPLGFVLSMNAGTQGTRYYPNDWTIGDKNSRDNFYIYSRNVFGVAAGDRDYVYFANESSWRTALCQEFSFRFYSLQDKLETLSEVELIVSREITEDMVTSQDQVYTGKPLGSTVKVMCGDIQLREGLDYTVEGENDTEPGTATVTVIGKGIYTGSVETSFKINPTVALADISGIKDQVYSGKAFTPNPVVKLGGKTLKKGTDYTVSYKNNKDIGVATVTVKGINGYVGTQTKTFRICFTDVPMTHNYRKAVYWASDAGIAAGYSGAKYGLFGVNDDITRGQVMMFLWRAAGKPAPKSSKQTFKDVPTTHAFYKAIQWGVEKGITGGYTGEKAGYFGPNDNCTRGQIATFLWRYAGKPAPKKNTKTFSDVPTKHNFYKAIQWASEQGITAGYSDGTFGVNKTCTRGQCVTFLYRLVKNK